MRVRRHLIVVVVAVAGISGCSDTGITGAPSSPATHPSATIGSAVDISGDWVWSDEEKLILPDWAVALAFPSIAPEGPTTVAHCRSTGILTLVQTGNTFSGSSQRTDHQCVTAGGQPFGGGPALAPQPIFDGRISGRSLVMHRAGNFTDCVYHATIDVANGAAAALRGNAQCVVPGHPQNGFLPLDPPPGGVDKVFAFAATRP